MIGKIFGLWKLFRHKTLKNFLNESFSTIAYKIIVTQRTKSFNFRRVVLRPENWSELSLNFGKRRRSGSQCIKIKSDNGVKNANSTNGFLRIRVSHVENSQSSNIAYASSIFGSTRSITKVWLFRGFFFCRATFKSSEPYDRNAYTEKKFYIAIPPPDPRALLLPQTARPLMFRENCTCFSSFLYLFS